MLFDINGYGINFIKYYDIFDIMKIYGVYLEMVFPINNAKLKFILQSLIAITKICFPKCLILPFVSTIGSNGFIICNFPT